MTNEGAYHRLAFKIFSDITGTLAVPAVLGAMLGKWLDTRYTTAPRYLFILLALALTASAISIVKKAKRYRDEYESINKI